MYSKDDLDLQVNNEETLIMYIQNSHFEFYDVQISREELEGMTTQELNDLIDHLDELWLK